MILILMGVAGCGKTTVGERLATELGWPFYDGDQFMPPDKVAKMASGIPLDDEDRRPWLAALRDLIAGLLRDGRSAVVATSALKQAYRAQLRVDPHQVRFVHLTGDPALIRRRLEGRAGHFMRPDMLASQLATLEEPADALRVDVAPSPEEIVSTIRRELGV